MNPPAEPVTGYALTLAEVQRIADTFGFIYYVNEHGYPALRDPVKGGGVFYARRYIEPGGDILTGEPRWDTWRAPRPRKTHDEIRLALGLPTWSQRYMGLK